MKEESRAEGNLFNVSKTQWLSSRMRIVEANLIFRNPNQSSFDSRPTKLQLNVINIWSVHICVQVETDSTSVFRIEFSNNEAITTEQANMAALPIALTYRPSKRVTNLYWITE